MPKISYKVEKATSTGLLPSTIQFRVELVDTAVEAGLDCREIVLGRHALDDEGEHFAEFVERRFLWCHMREV
jgi:hypothetical protein